MIDYIDTLQDGQRISYWWSDEDGWLRGTISKGLKKIVTASTIKWTIAVAFDNGEKRTLPFHPLDKRWKVFHSSVKPSITLSPDEPKKKSVSVKFPVSTKATKAMGEKIVGRDTENKKAKADRIVDEEKNSRKSDETCSASVSSSSSKPKAYKQISLSLYIYIYI